MNMTLMTSLEAMTEDELQEVYKFTADRINELHRKRQRLAAFKFSVNDKVQFYSPKLHRNVVGVITKVNASSIKLTENNLMRWTVSPDLLTKVV